MSEPKRFDCLSDGMWQNSAGDYVLHSDYARLKAEVERLRKAGDDLRSSIISGTSSEEWQAIEEWDSANEGGHP